MTTELKLIGFAALGTLALQAMPAAAELRANTHEVQIHAGELFGDDLAETSISGQTPELDDEVAYGVRYGYTFTDSWGLQLSVGRSPSSVTELAGADVDLDVTTLDVDAVWNFGGRSRWAPYLVAGVGYAWADLDNPIQGTLNDESVSIDDDNGYTLNAGIGTRYLATDRIMIQVEARYRYRDRLLDAADDSLNTVETTVGVGWRF
jgi:outer membrane protein